MIKPNDHLSESDILITVSQDGIHSPWEDHLSECETCQSALERIAAEQLHWQAVREILTTGEIEFDVGSLTTSHLEQVKRESTSKEESSLVSQLLEPPTHPEMLGRVGRYEVERLLGTGGMGVVFKAYDTELHRAVAIKFLAPHLIHSGAARKRFAREARAAAAIVNDHVVPIHNVETEAEHPYLVMQYIGGDSLQDRIDREGPLELSEILRIGMQIATGLAAAHAQGLTHRDIKPSNIMLDENVSRALLTDFGLARTNDDASLTRSGVHLGTPNFMSPEQVRNEAIDQRSDLFSFGCVLYALCTGRPPFRAEQAFAVMRRITDEAPRPICETNPNIPEWLERIVLRLMSKQVEDRYQSAHEVAELLKECLAHATAPSDHTLPVSLMASSSTGRGGNRYLGWLIAIVGSFGILLAGVLVILESSKGTITIQSDADDVPIRVTKSGQVVERFTVSQDGKSLRVAAGEYAIELENQEAGLEIKGDQVLVKRGESSIVTIALEQKNHKTLTDTNVSELAAKGTPSNLLRSLRVIENGAVVEGNGVVKQVADRILNATAHELGNPRLWDEVILTLHLTRSQELMGQTHSSNKYESTRGVKSVEIFIHGTQQQIIDNQLPDQIRQAGIWAMIPAAPRWIGVGYGKLDMLSSERMKLTEHLLQSREYTLEAIMDSTYLQGNARPVGSFQDSSAAAALILFEYLKQERGLQAILDFGRAIQAKQELNAALKQHLHYGSRERLIETLGEWLDSIRATSEAKISALSGSTISKAGIDTIPVSFPKEMQGNWIVQVASRSSFKVPSYIKQQVDIDSQFITLRTHEIDSRYRITRCAPLQTDLFAVDLTAIAQDGSGTKTFQCLMQVWDNRIWLVRPQDPSQARPHRYALDARPHRYASDSNGSTSELVLSMNRSPSGTSTKDAPPEVTTDPSLVGSSSDDPTNPPPRNLEAGSDSQVLPKSIIGQWVIENATSRSTPIPAYAGQQVWIAADSITIARDGTPSRYHVTHWKPLPGNVFELDLAKNLPNSTTTTTFQCLMSVDGQKIRLCRPQRPGRSRPSQQELEGKSDPGLYRGETTFELRSAAQGGLSFDRLWRKPAESGQQLQCPIVQYEGRVYAAYPHRVVGLDLHDGSVKWEQQVPKGIAGGMTIQDGWLVVGDRAKNVYCFSTRDSSKRWQVELESNLAVQPTINKAFRSDDYTVILPTEQGPIQCVSLASGNPVYRFDKSVRATGPVSAVGGMALVVASGNDQILHRFICRDGARQPVSISTDFIVSHRPAVHQEFVHVRTGDGGVAKYDMIGESFEWNFEPEKHQKPTTSPAIFVGDTIGPFPHDGIVVFTLGDSIYGVDWRQGTVVWQRCIGSNLTDPVIAGGQVWIGTELGNLYALNVKNGKIVWDCYVAEESDSIVQPPVYIQGKEVFGNRILVATEKGEIVCFGEKEVAHTDPQLLIEPSDSKSLTTPDEVKAHLRQLIRRREKLDGVYAEFRVSRPATKHEEAFSRKYQLWYCNGDRRADLFAIHPREDQVQIDSSKHGYFLNRLTAESQFREGRTPPSLGTIPEIRRMGLVVWAAEALDVNPMGADLLIAKHDEFTVTNLAVTQEELNGQMMTCVRYHNTGIPKLKSSTTEVWLAPAFGNYPARIISRSVDENDNGEGRMQLDTSWKWDGKDWYPTSTLFDYYSIFKGQESKHQERVEVLRWRRLEPIDSPVNVFEPENAITRMDSDQAQQKITAEAAAKIAEVRSGPVSRHTIVAWTTGHGRPPKVGGFADLFVNIPGEDSSDLEVRPVVRRGLVTNTSDANPTTTNNREVRIELELTQAEVDRIKMYEPDTFTFAPVD